MCIFGDLRLPRGGLRRWLDEVEDALSEVDGYGGDRGTSFVEIKRKPSVQIRGFLEKSEFAELKSPLASLAAAAARVGGSGELVFLSDPRQANRVGYRATSSGMKPLSHKDQRALAKHPAVQEVLGRVTARLASKRAKEKKRVMTAADVEEGMRRRLRYSPKTAVVRQRVRAQTAKTLRQYLDGTLDAPWTIDEAVARKLIARLER